jgi:hypothetical protein
MQDFTTTGLKQHLFVLTQARKVGRYLGNLNVLDASRAKFLRS